MGSCPIPFLGLALRTLTVTLVTVLHLLGWTYSDLVAEQVSTHYRNRPYTVISGVGAIISMMLCYLYPPTSLAACRSKARRLAYRLRRLLLMPMI